MEVVDEDEGSCASDECFYDECEDEGEEESGEGGEGSEIGLGSEFLEGWLCIGYESEGDFCGDE